MYRVRADDYRLEVEIAAGEKAEASAKSERYIQEVRQEFQNWWWKNVQAQLPQWARYFRAGSKHYYSCQTIIRFLEYRRAIVQLPGWPQAGATNRIRHLSRDYFRVILPHIIKYRGFNGMRAHQIRIAEGGEGVNERRFNEYIAERNQQFAPCSYWTNEDQDDIDRRAAENLQRVRDAESDLEKLNKITDPIERIRALARLQGADDEEVQNIVHAFTNLDDNC